MKLFGTIAELLQVRWRKDGQEITSRPNQSTTYTAPRDIQLPPGDTAHVLVSATSTQTLTNKTIDADANTITNIENADIKAGAAIDAAKLADGSVDNIEFQRLGTAGTAGAGNLVTTDGTQTVTNKTIDGDNNTVQDLAITSLKTELADANKVLRRDASGVPESGNLIPNTSALVTTDATQTLTGKTIDGDDNTLSDIDITSLKADALNPNTVLRRDNSGVVEANNTIPDNSQLVTVSATQSLDNKTLASPTITGQDVNFIEYNDQVSDPSTPAGAGDVRLYAKDNLLYQIDSNGIVQEVGSGGGAGGINYIENPDAESDTAGYATYADAASSVPTDGTGGSPTVTYTRSTSAPLRGAASFLLTKDAANRQGEGASYAFSIDSADVNKSLQISFDVDASDANYVANDMAVYIYDVTNAALITPASVNIAAAKYTLQTTFVASNSTSYRLIFHVASTNASAYAVKFDNISVGPELAALGVSVVDFPTSAISASNFTNATGLTITGRCSGQRVGGNLHLRLTANFAGTGSDAADMLFDLSDFFGAITVASGVYEGGTARTDNATATSRAPFLVFAVGNGTSNIGFAGSAAGSVLDGNTYGDSGSLTDQMDVTLILPINEWIGSAVYLNQAVPEYLANNNAGVTAATDYDTGFVYGPNGTPFVGIGLTGTGNQRTRYRCRALTPIQITDRLVPQIYDGVDWVDTDSTEFHAQKIGNFYYGMGIQRISGSSTDFYVTFGNRGADEGGVTYNAAGRTYSDLASASYRWRVVKIPGQVQATTFSLPTQMTNEQATAMGFKTYLHGTTYNGGNAPTITLSSGGGTLTSAVGRFIPYQVQDGSWRLKFNINAELSSTSRTSAVLAIAGITTTSTAYAVSGINFALVSQYAYAPASNNVVNCTHSSTTTQFYEFSGDIPLASKPTWAY